VGSNLACSFKKDNPDWQVISLDNLHRQGSEINVSRLKETGVDFVRGDIRNKEDLEQIGKFDLLIECSAEPSVLAGYGENPEYLINTNLVGTLNCLERCRVLNSDIIFLSTSRVYPMELINNLKYEETDSRFELVANQGVDGVSEYGFSERLSLEGVRSLYGGTKLCSEIMTQEYIAAYGFKGVINRCGVLAGPCQMGKVDQGFVSLWVARHLWKGKLSYIGYGGIGKQVRDILHVVDLYELLTIQIEKLDEINGDIFNVGGGVDVSVSLCELTDICQTVTGNKISMSSVPETRSVDIPYYISDCSKIEDVLGWKPTRTADIIVKDVFEWMQDNSEMLKPILCV